MPRPESCKGPPLGEGGPSESRGVCNSPIRPNQAATQVKKDLLVDDIGCNVSAMMAQLDVVLAMRAADDSTGILYGLRRANAYWNLIAASARDLASLNESARS